MVGTRLTYILTMFVFHKSSARSLRYTRNEDTTVHDKGPGSYRTWRRRG